MDKKDRPAHINAAFQWWNENPMKAPASLSGLVAIFEGADVLLSALAEIDPDFVLTPEQDIPTLLTAVVEARPHWFPHDDEWHDNAYPMVKMRLLEHDVRLDTLSIEAALNWMKQSNVQSVRVGDLKKALSQEQ